MFIPAKLKDWNLKRKKKKNQMEFEKYTMTITDKNIVDFLQQNQKIPIQIINNSYVFVKDDNLLTLLKQYETMEVKSG